MLTGQHQTSIFKESHRRTHEPCTNEHLHRLGRSLQNSRGHHYHSAHEYRPLAPEAITEIRRYRKTPERAYILNSSKQSELGAAGEIEGGFPLINKLKPVYNSMRHKLVRGSVIEE